MDDIQLSIYELEFAGIVAESVKSSQRKSDLVTLVNAMSLAQNALSTVSSPNARNILESAYTDARLYVQSITFWDPNNS